MKDKKGSENSMTNHLSCLEISDIGDINNIFPNEHTLANSNKRQLFVHIVNFLVIGSIQDYWAKELIS